MADTFGEIGSAHLSPLRHRLGFRSLTIPGYFLSFFYLLLSCLISAAGAFVD